MNIKKDINQIEYLSLSLVLSFFLFHNIFIVLIGCTLALYKINNTFFDQLFKFIKNITLQIKNLKLENSFPTGKKTIKIEKDDQETSLVERIEELGFIPSLEKKNEIDAA